MITRIVLLLSVVGACSTSHHPEPDAETGVVDTGLADTAFLDTSSVLDAPATDGSRARIRQLALDLCRATAEYCELCGECTLVCTPVSAAQIDCAVRVIGGRTEEYVAEAEIHIAHSQSKNRCFEERGCDAVVECTACDPLIECPEPSELFRALRVCD